MLVYNPIIAAQVCGGGFFHGCKMELADKEKLLQEAFGLLYGRMSLRFISGSHSL